MESKKSTNSFKDLIVWQKSMDLVIKIYQITNKFPKSEVYGISSQMRRSAVSIPSNIAEGRRRGSRKEYCNFLLIAYGSGAELETQAEIVKRLGFIDISSYNEISNLLTEIMKMLNSMLSKIRS